jgi:hypothetical protein
MRSQSFTLAGESHVAYFEQVLLLPMAQYWLPGLAFLLVVGAGYWFVRHWSLLAHARAHARAQVAESAQAGAVKLVTAGPLPPRPAEKRVWSRRQGSPVEVFVKELDDKYAPDRASVVDRSTGGIQLAARFQINVGTPLTVRPVHAAEMVPWTDLEVRYCNPSAQVPGEYEVGCQFVKTPPYSILLLFG